MDRVFALRQVCEKYLANGKDVFSSFMHMEKAYDTIDRHGMWLMLKVYEVRGKPSKDVQSFYIDSRAIHPRACVRVGNDVSTWFPVKCWIETGLCDVSMVV